MGLLVDGQWHDKWYDTKKHGGRFVRSESQFRNTVAQGTEFEPESWALSPLRFLRLSVGSPGAYLP